MMKIELGQQVRVRDGSPEPPLRFVRKHEQWRNANYEGVVVGIDQERAQCRIQFGDFRNRCFVLYRSGVPLSHVSVDPERPGVVPLKACGMDHMVDVEAWLAMKEAAA